MKSATLPEVLPDPARAWDGCWELYEQQKAAYLAEHPDASPEEIEAGMREIARGLGL